MDLTKTLADLRKSGIPKGDLNSFAAYCGNTLGFTGGTEVPCARDARRAAFPTVKFSPCDAKKCLRLHIEEATGAAGERPAWGAGKSVDAAMLKAIGEAMPTTLGLVPAALSEDE